MPSQRMRRQQYLNALVGSADARSPALDLVVLPSGMGFEW